MTDNDKNTQDTNELTEIFLDRLITITPPVSSFYVQSWRSVIENIAAYLTASFENSTSGMMGATCLRSDQQFYEKISAEIVDLLRENQTLSIIPIVKICRVIEGLFKSRAKQRHPESENLYWQRITAFFEGLEVNAVEKHHLKLAELVEDRTVKLQVANKSLENQIQIRCQTEHDLLEFAARLKASNEELEQFAHIASHDLKEPLTLILAFGERLLRKYGYSLDKKGLEYAKRLVKAARQMSTLVDDLLAMSRISSMACTTENVDLTDLVKDVVEGLEERIAHSDAQVSISPLGCFGGDPTQLRQLFQNIIVNALKYRQETRSPVVVIRRCLGRSDQCEIIVEDNGIGFDPLLVELIFRPFSRLHGNDKYDGTGIGLATCRKIVVRHGGEITARSVPGVGSTFIVRLPLRGIEKK